jgi:hypothetical protein
MSTQREKQNYRVGQVCFLQSAPRVWYSSSPHSLVHPIHAWLYVFYLQGQPIMATLCILQANTNVLVRIAASSDEHAMGLAIYMWPSVLQMSNCVTIILMTSDGKMIQPPYLKWWIKGKSWRRVGKNMENIICLHHGKKFIFFIVNGRGENPPPDLLPRPYNGP